MSRGPTAAIPAPSVPRPRNIGNLLFMTTIVAIIGSFFVLGPGTAWDILFINPLINALMLAVTTENIGGEAFQIASNQETTVGEITDKIVSILNQNGVADIIVVNGDTRLGDVKRNYSDTSKARTKLGWQPAMTQEEGLKRTIEYFVK